MRTPLEQFDKPAVGFFDPVDLFGPSCRSSGSVGSVRGGRQVLADIAAPMAFISAFASISLLVNCLGMSRWPS